MVPAPPALIGSITLPGLVIVATPEDVPVYRREGWIHRWIDADGDGQHTSPREYARREIQRAKGSLANVIAALKPYDQAVAAQAASLLHEAGHDPRSGPLGQALKPAAPMVRAGFDTYAATLPAAKE